MFRGSVKMAVSLIFPSKNEEPTAIFITLNRVHRGDGRGGLESNNPKIGSREPIGRVFSLN